MLSNGRIPHNSAEGEAIDRLLAKHPGKPASFTRRDPGDSGPVIVEIDGAGVWHVHDGGRAQKQRRR